MKMHIKAKIVKPPVFYNYEPSNKNLKTFCIPRPETKEIEKEIIKEYELEIQKALTGNILDQINAKDINTDLKRDLKKKLDILSKKTDESVIELIKQKLKKNNQESMIKGANNEKHEHTTNDAISNNEHTEENIGHVLRQALDKLDFLDESNEMNYF